MSSSVYQNILLPVVNRVEESKEISYCSITERHIQALWFEQKYFKDLTTSDGKRITIISPGIWNTESGPDFLKAHIKIEEVDYFGDIEIHLNEESWYQHHHHEDERYNQVILHISLWQPKNRKTILKKNEISVLSAYLEKALTVPSARLLHLIDIDLYPYKRCLGSGKCSRALFKTLSDEEIISFFTSASYWRLEQKRNYLQHRIVSKSLQLAGGLAMALGYKQNAEPFLELFLFLLNYRDLPIDELFSISLGCCGFFDKKVPMHWLKSSYYQFLKMVWEGKRSEVLHQTLIRLDHIRPFNHPVRRLAYLVRFLNDPAMENLWTEINLKWKWHVNELKGDIKANRLLKQEMFDLIPTYLDEYWNSHYTFESKPKKEFLSLIGEDVKSGILINTILPLLYQEIKESGNPLELQIFQLFYQDLRPSIAQKSRYLTDRFFGETRKKKILNAAQMEQGAYQLHKDFCVHFEASCEGCPFIERYAKCNLVS